MSRKDTDRIVLARGAPRTATMLMLILPSGYSVSPSKVYIVCDSAASSSPCSFSALMKPSAISSVEHSARRIGKYPTVNPSTSLLVAPMVRVTLVVKLLSWIVSMGLLFLGCRRLFEPLDYAGGQKNSQIDGSRNFSPHNICMS